MFDFEQSLAEEVAGYHGPDSAWVKQAPAFYRLMSQLLEDPRLPARLRPFVFTALGYYATDSDILPEYLSGPSGYLDDVYVSALAAHHVHLAAAAAGDSDILESNWEGDRPLLSLVGEILSQALNAEQRELVHWFIGYEYLPK